VNILLKAMGLIARNYLQKQGCKLVLVKWLIIDALLYTPHHWVF